MKKQLNERFQELAGIKPLHVTETSLNEADHYGFLQDISNHMRGLPSDERKGFLEAIQRFVAAKLKDI